jgi:hypothetical protein
LLTILPSILLVPIVQSGHLNETIIKPTEELQHKLEQMEASRKVFEEKK